MRHNRTATFDVGQKRTWSFMSASLSSCCRSY